MRFDAMHAVTGPYARAILERSSGRSGRDRGQRFPLPDFGGGHPDPNPVYAADLVAALADPRSGLSFGAASDGDGDRNMIVGRELRRQPERQSGRACRQLHALVPAYAGGWPASPAPCRRVARSTASPAALGIPCFETPTGWKFFGTLLDAGKATLCGEESAGTGSNHVREKDGLWAVLYWLNILAARNETVEQIVREHWRRFGRNVYSRHDYEGSRPTGRIVLDELRARLPTWRAQESCGMRIAAADDFSYTDPVDGSRSERRGCGSCSTTVRGSSSGCRAPAPKGATLAPLSRALRRRSGRSTRCRRRRHWRR
jgi:phosphoglucomutase